MPEPSPAKTKMSMEMNSARAALRASGWLASAGVPTAILEIVIFQIFFLKNEIQNSKMLENPISCSLSLSFPVYLLLISEVYIVWSNVSGSGTGSAGCHPVTAPFSAGTV